MAIVQHINADTDSKKIIEILNQDGCVVIDNVLSKSEILNLQKDLSLHLDRIPDCQGDFYGHATKRLGCLFTKSDLFQKIAVIPSI